MKLSKRIELLERKLSDSEVTLRMANGSKRTVRTRRLIRMIGEILSGSIAADTQAVIDSVDDNCREVGEGRLPEVLKTIYASRTEVAKITDFSMLSDQGLAELDRIGNKLTGGCQSTEEVG
jgi:hypothetical protein